jgi:hypothetical protein
MTKLKTFFVIYHIYFTVVGFNPKIIALNLGIPHREGQYACYICTYVHMYVNVCMYICLLMCENVYTNMYLLTIFCQFFRTFECQIQPQHAENSVLRRQPDGRIPAPGPEVLALRSSSERSPRNVR